MEDPVQNGPDPQHSDPVDQTLDLFLCLFHYQSTRLKIQFKVFNIQG